MMPDPTVNNLASQMAALQNQMDIAILPVVQEIAAILARPEVTQAVDDLAAALVNLPESVELRALRNQANNVVTVLTNVQRLFDAEQTRISALVPIEEEPE